MMVSGGIIPERLCIQVGHWLPKERGVQSNWFSRRNLADLDDLQITLSEQSTNAFNLMCKVWWYNPCCWSIAGLASVDPCIYKDSMFALQEFLRGHSLQHKARYMKCYMTILLLV